MTWAGPGGACVTFRHRAEPAEGTGSVGNGRLRGADGAAVFGLRRSPE